MEELFCDEVDLFVEEVGDIFDGGLEDEVEFGGIVDWVDYIGAFVDLLMGKVRNSW